MNEVAVHPKKRVYQVWREVEGVKYPHEICYGLDHLHRHVAYWSVQVMQASNTIGETELKSRRTKILNTLSEYIPCINMLEMLHLDVTAKVTINIRRIDDNGREAI